MKTLTIELPDDVASAAEERANRANMTLAEWIASRVAGGLDWAPGGAIRWAIHTDGSRKRRGRWRMPKIFASQRIDRRRISPPLNCSVQAWRGFLTPMSAFSTG